MSTIKAFIAFMAEEEKEINRETNGQSYGIGVSEGMKISKSISHKKEAKFRNWEL